MHILVTFGSKRGGTAGIAEMIGEELRTAGHTADVVSASAGPNPEGYGAVIMGGALYANRWPANVRRFVRRHADRLRCRPVWLFSSGPLDDKATREAIAPTKSVARLAALIRARGHMTFGGRLAPDARGFVAANLAKSHAGDWRDPAEVRGWAAETAAVLNRLPPAAPAPHPTPTFEWPGERSPRASLVALSLFSGVTACVGGLALALSPDGSMLRASLSLLRHTPFVDFRVPGFILFALVGIPNLLAGLAHLSARKAIAERMTVIAGTALTGFIAVEMFLLRSATWLQLLYLVVGLVIVVQSLKLHRRREGENQETAATA